MQVLEEEKRKMLKQALANVLVKLRKKNNLSARAVAYSVDLSKTTLLNAEKGELDPQLSTFCKIAEAFYLKPEKLLQMIFQELPKGWNFFDENN